MVFIKRTELSAYGDCGYRYLLRVQAVSYTHLWTLGIRDKRLICIISKMLKAEIDGEGVPEKGTPQGGLSLIHILYKKNEVVKTIHTDLEGVASTSADLLPYGNFRIVESEAPDGYLTDGAKPIDFTITENGKIVDLTDKAHSIYNQIKRGDIEGVKIGAGTHKRLANVPFRITSKTTGENHVVVTCLLYTSRCV